MCIGGGGPLYTPPGVTRTESVVNPAAVRPDQRRRTAASQTILTGGQGIQAGGMGSVQTTAKTLLGN